MHQLKRLESPNFMIINHDASSLPNFRTEVLYFWLDFIDLREFYLFELILLILICSYQVTFFLNKKFLNLN